MGLTSLSGSPTTSSPPFAISPPRDSRWPSPSSETPLPSRRCSSVSESSSPPCSEERPYRQMNRKLDQVYLQRGYKRPSLLSIHLAQLLQEPFLEELLAVRLDHGLDF